MPGRAKARAGPRGSSCIPRRRRRPLSATCWRSCRRAAMPEESGTEILNLGRDFPPVPTAEWEAAIRKDLKGADYGKRLMWRTDEGIAVRPYYRAENLAGLESQTETVPGRFPFV